jgi:hypothetical protein
VGTAAPLCVPLPAFRRSAPWRTSSNFVSGSTELLKRKKRGRSVPPRAAITGCLVLSATGDQSIRTFGAESAAELAQRDAIGVFPVSGWWKEKPALQWWDRSARYALIVSVRAPGANIDIYTAIANKLEIPIPAA